MEKAVVAAVEEALELPESERRDFLRRRADLSLESRETATRLLAECETVEREEAAEADADSAAASDGRERRRSPALELNLREIFAALPVEGADAARARRLAAESTLGPFRITRFVAAGGMGEVYEAIDMRVGRRVALKTLPLFSGAERGDRFAREAVLMARLEHPSIARLYEWGSASADGGVGEVKIPYIAMEFVEGRSLREALAELRTRGASAAQLVEFLLPVADAVAHAHARGVLHRDIKPSNVIVDGQGVLRLLDFGVAALIDEAANDSLTMTEAAAPGTLTYMSPEQVRGGTRRVTTQSDVYALGLLVHEALRGAPVVDPAGRGIAELIEEVLQRDPPRLFPSVTGVSPDLDFVIRKALAKEPDRRYRSADALAEDLRRSTRGESPLGQDLGPFALLRRLAWRRRRSIALAAAIVVALGAVLAFGAAQFVRAREAEARAEVFVGQLLEGSKPILFDLHVKLIAENQPLAARKAALEATVAYLEWVQANAKDDERVLAEIARRYRALASVAGSTGDASLGDGETASKYYLRSLAILDALLQRSAANGDASMPDAEFRSALLLDRSNVLRDYAGQFDYADRAAYYARALVDQRSALALMPPGSKRDKTERYLLFTEVQAARLAVDAVACEVPLARMRAMAMEARFAENSEFLSELGIAEYLLMQLCELREDFDEALARARASKAAFERSIALGQDDFTNNRHVARVDLLIVSRTGADRTPAESMDRLLSALKRSQAATNLRPEGSFQRLSHVEAIDLFASAAKTVAMQARAAGDADAVRDVVQRTLAAIDDHLAYVRGLPTEGVPHRGEPELLSRLATARAELESLVPTGGPSPPRP